MLFPNLMAWSNPGNIYKPFELIDPTKIVKIGVKINHKYKFKILLWLKMFKNEHRSEVLNSTILSYGMVLVMTRLQKYDPYRSWQ